MVKSQEMTVPERRHGTTLDARLERWIDPAAPRLLSAATFFTTSPRRRVPPPLHGMTRRRGSSPRICSSRSRERA